MTHESIAYSPESGYVSCSVAFRSEVVKNLRLHKDHIISLYYDSPGWVKPHTRGMSKSLWRYDANYEDQDSV